MPLSNLDYVRLTGMYPATNNVSPSLGTIVHSDVGAGLDGTVMGTGLNIRGSAMTSAKVSGTTLIIIALGITAFYVVTRGRQF